ncbi:hypothetical protein [Actinomadura sp. WAC 06369]|uniref:hypothetical protein n=1 Tax=Actinomadura sp. WAC 06369 TaxID=2203193 RepID=UPI001F1D8320|nr:hypothetical protein [Actinomadura sp. WAC 06369]
MSERHDVDPQVLARARARVLGVPSIDAAEPVPSGVRTASDGTRVWLLPEWPDGATPALLEEYDTAPMPLDRAGQARRVLAAALRCCWLRLDDAPWPGTPAPVGHVLEVYGGMTRGDADLARRWATGELRRLADTGWLLLDEGAGTVRPGPRTALWPEGSLASLRDLLRRLPHPPQAAEPPQPPEGGSAPAAAEDPQAPEAAKPPPEGEPPTAGAPPSQTATAPETAGAPGAPETAESPTVEPPEGEPRAAGLAQPDEPAEASEASVASEPSDAAAEPSADGGGGR